MNEINHPLLHHSVSSLKNEPQRIVSLVPSVTELIADFGAAERIVGRTDWCDKPRYLQNEVPALGGTKNPKIVAILEQAPDLVIANREENRKIDVKRILEKQVPVWLTDVRSVDDCLRLLDEAAELTAANKDARSKISDIRSAVGERKESVASRTPVFCPIWKDPWMSPSEDTYIHSLIELCGGRNVFPTPGRRSRYPEVQKENIIDAQPQCVLLPNEPYEFSEIDRAEILQWDIPASHETRVHCIDGAYLMWYGLRLGEALRTLPPLLN